MKCYDMNQMIERWRCEERQLRVSERRPWYSVVGLRSIKFRLPITSHRTMRLRQAACLPQVTSQAWRLHVRSSRLTWAYRYYLHDTCSVSHRPGCCCRRTVVNIDITCYRYIPSSSRYLVAIWTKFYEQQSETFTSSIFKPHRNH